MSIRVFVIKKKRKFTNDRVLCDDDENEKMRYQQAGAEESIIYVIERKNIRKID